MVVQEDGASLHISSFKDNLYSLSGVTQLLWPGNSPDLNMIEPAWPHAACEADATFPATKRMGNRFDNSELNANPVASIWPIWLSNT